jgi:hypothetical protein
MFLTGVGVLARQRVVSPDLGSNLRSELPDVVLAIRDPLHHPMYRLMAEFPEGKVYALAQ